MQREKVSLTQLRAWRQHGKNLTMLTAYDYPMACFLDEAGIDIIAVGDSVGPAVLGYPDCRSVTMEDMVHHCSAVRRGASCAYLVGDMPPPAIEGSIAQTVSNARRLVEEAGMDCVKVEGGLETVPATEAIVSSGIPVMAHIVYAGSRSPGLEASWREEDAVAARNFLASTRALGEAGAFGIVLARVPPLLARLVTERSSLITIGINSGPYCHGQVLVTQDMLGLAPGPTPEFSQRFVDLAPQIRATLRQFVREVEHGVFPPQDERDCLDDEVWEALLAEAT